MRNASAIATTSKPPRRQEPSAGLASGCGWDASKACEKIERIGWVTAGRAPNAPSAGATQLEPAVVNPLAATPYRLTKIAAASGQLSIPAPEGLGKASMAANALPARQGVEMRGSALSMGAAYTNQDDTPGPYAMLVIGISLAVFMTFRRMGNL